MLFAGIINKGTEMSGQFKYRRASGYGFVLFPAAVVSQVVVESGFAISRY